MLNDILVALKLKKKPPTMTLQAIVTRADGTVEDLGVISTGYVEFTPEKEK